jgi:hypothetical protein
MTVNLKKDPFVKVPLWWMKEATAATRTPKALICIELLYISWKNRSASVPMSNGRLAKLGISRETKRRALLQLEAAGLVTVDRHRGRAPVVTLVAL